MALNQKFQPTFSCVVKSCIRKSKLLKNVYNLDQTLENYDNNHLILIFLYGSEKFIFNLNNEIIKLNICFLKYTERFSESLIWNIYCLFLFVIILIIIILLNHDIDFWHIFTLTLLLLVVVVVEVVVVVFILCVL